MNPPTPDFIQIPKPVLQNKNLKPNDKFLFGYIYWMTRLALMKCTASNATLAAMAGVSDKTVRNSLTNLKHEGCIAIKYSGNPHSKNTRREIICLVKYVKHVGKSEDTRKQRYVGKSGDTGVPQFATNKEYINNNKNNKAINNKNSGKPVDKNSPGYKHALAARLALSNKLR